MRTDLSGRDQRRGFGKLMIWGSVAAAILLLAVTFWPLLPGPETGKPAGQEKASEARGQSAPAGRETFSNQGSGESRVGKNEPGAPDDNTGAKARDIQGSSQNLSLSEEQRTQVRNVLSRSSMHRVDVADFTVSIGAAVPRQVQLQPLPNELSEALGGYRGGEYIMVRDQLVIVDRESRRVVAIVPGVG
jgi:Protein of unknown function (DUF1236)